MALAGRNAVIFGVANKWSLAWTVAKQWHQAGANLALVCASDRIAGSVRGLVSSPAFHKAVGLSSKLWGSSQSFGAAPDFFCNFVRTYFLESSEI